MMSHSWFEYVNPVSPAARLLEAGHDIRTVLGTAGPSRREDDDDLHPCPWPRSVGGPQPSGRTLTAFTEVVTWTRIKCPITRPGRRKHLFLKGLYRA